MGLDVYGYRDVAITYDEDDYDFIVSVIDDNWKYKVENLSYGDKYIGEKVDASVSYGYGMHNRFREELIRIIGRNDLIVNDRIDWDKLCADNTIPFYELINFADNEGCLDYKISEKLYDEFLEWKDIAITYCGDNLRLKGYYLDWLEIFKYTRDNGVVVFT